MPSRRPTINQCTAAAALGATLAASHAPAGPVPEHPYLTIASAMNLSVGTTPTPSSAPRPGAKPTDPSADSPVHLALIDPADNRRLDDAFAPAGCIDAAWAFPALVRSPPQQAVLMQELSGDMPIGAALVLIPLWTSAPTRTALEAQVMQAFLDADRTRLEQLLSLSDSVKQAMADTPARLEPARRAFTGYLAVEDRRILLETSLGEIELALRWDQAPLAAARFLRLVDAGFYDGAPLHRVVGAGADGLPVLVQGGDPSGTGLGGCGERLAFEPTTIAQGFGIVSAARAPDDPESASSQFVITLGSASGRAMQGKYAAFAVVTRGAAVLERMAALAVGPRDPDDPLSPRDRPLAAPVIVHARNTSAPAFTGPVQPQRANSAPLLER